MVSIHEPNSHPCALTGPKKQSAYNKFMADEIKRVKAANPNIEHKAAFKKV